MIKDIYVSKEDMIGICKLEKVFYDFKIDSPFVSLFNIPCVNALNNVNEHMNDDDMLI